MNYLEIFDEVKKNTLHGVYLFHGEEEYVKAQALDQAIQSYTIQSFGELNCRVFEAEDTGIHDIISMCDAFPFFSKQRLVVVKDLVVAGSNKSLLIAKFVDYIKILPETTCLILYYRGKVDMRTAIPVCVKKIGKLIEFQHLKHEELMKWLMSACRRYKLGIDKQTAEYLIHIVGNRIFDLNNELQKLVQYAERNNLTTNDIDEVVVPNMEHNVFQMLDAIIEKNPNNALKMIYSLISQGEETFSILGMISKHFHMMLQCRILKQEGYSDALIAKKIEGHPFAVKKYIEQSRFFTFERIKKAIELCLQTDHSIKSGILKEKIALEMLLIQLTITTGSKKHSVNP